MVLLVYIFLCSGVWVVWTFASCHLLQLSNLNSDENNFSAIGFVLPLDKPSHDFHPPEEKERVKRRQHQRVFNTTQKKTWLVPLLLCVVALATLIISCFRGGRLGRSSRNEGRKLASERQPGNGNDEEEEAILEMCLDLQEESAASVIYPAATPLPQTHDTAIASILRYLHEPFSQRGPEIIQQSADASSISGSLESTATFFSPQPDPSQVAEGAVWGPFQSTASHHQEAVPLQEAPLPLSQHLHSSTFPLLEGQQQEEQQPTSGPERRRRGTGPDQEESDMPPPKKHTSGWKRRKEAPSGLEDAPASLQPQPQPLGLGSVESIEEEDPLSIAVQAVLESYSPPPLLIPGTEESSEVQGPEGFDPILKAIESVSVEHYIPSLQLSPIRTPIPTPSIEEDGGHLLSLDSPGPSTSQGVRGALPAAPQDDVVPGPSSEAAASATPQLSSDGASGDVQQPSAPPAPPQPGSPHLFYRLPILQQGVITRTFDVSRAFSKENVRGLGRSSLNMMRSVLAQSVVTPADAAILVGHSEIIAGRLFEELLLPVDNARPSRAAFLLGRAFVSLDALVAAIQLLGPVMKSSEWWPMVASRVPSRRVYSAGKKSMKTSHFHAALATDLSRALQTLRRCTRLPEKETIALKRRLLCSGNTVAEFKESHWHPWREDDAKSKES